jgi:cell wall-associated NlpC family hydrolase
MNLSIHDKKELRDILIEISKSFLNIPYKYNGKSPINGLDCSQVVVEGLMQIGYIPWNFDYSAQGLWEKFSVKYPVSKEPPGPGALAFWFKDGSAVHVAICTSRIMTIQASGGNSKTDTLSEADEASAYVKYKRVDIDKRECRFIDIFPETRGI